MTPQLVDLNFDGHQDMVLATFEGTAFFIEGSAEGWKKPKHIVDKNDSNVRISMYYDMQENEYKNVDRSTSDYENVEEHHMTSIALIDWDEDGDQDLVLGAYEGALYLCMNEGTPAEPRFAETNEQIKANGKPLIVKGGLATPRIVDWNGDGLFDILCGGSHGGVYYYANTGAKGDPKFAEARTLIATTIQLMESPGNMDADEDADDAVAKSLSVYDYYNSMMVPVRDGLPTCPGTSFHIETVDYDGDGDLDLLVGAQSYFKQDQKTLTDEEKTELDSLNAKMEDVQARFTELLEGKDQDEMEVLYKTEKYQKLGDEMSEMYQRTEELHPEPKPANFIWLYRNKGERSSVGK